jgi:DNA-binding SARP family transcriptional activator
VSAVGTARRAFSAETAPALGTTLHEDRGRKLLSSFRPPAQLTLLDAFRLEDGSGQLISVPANVQRLLAFVALNGRVLRTHAAGLLWPEVDEVHAHGSLRSTIWRLHRIWPGLLCSAEHSLDIRTDTRVDYRELLQTARRLLEHSEFSDDREVRVLTGNGELLPGWYDDWIFLERERMRQLRLHALEALAEVLARKGRYADALEAGLIALRGEPLRESAHRAVIAVHLLEGNTGEAIRQYEQCKRLLREELGVRPTPQTTRLLKDVAWDSAAVTQR